MFPLLIQGGSGKCSPVARLVVWPIFGRLNRELGVSVVRFAPSGAHPQLSRTYLHTEDWNVGISPTCPELVM